MLICARARCPDANKFGAAYLAKLGWDPSRGLGVSGEGRTKALSVNQKLDMLGIGADHRNSAEGLAWKQNKDFENLLRRLNAANGNGDDEVEEPMKIDGFVRPTAQADESLAATPVKADGSDEAGGAQEDGEKRSKKKRKKGEDVDEGAERKKKRKKSKSSEDVSDAEENSTKEKKKKKRDTAVTVTPTETASPSPAPTPGPSRQ